MARLLEQVLAEYNRRQEKLIHHPELDSRIHLTQLSPRGDEGIPTLEDFTDFAKVFESHTWVRRAVTLIASNFAKVKVVVKDENNEIVDKHVLTDRLTYVNDTYSPYVLWYWWIEHHLLGGESFVEIAWNENEEPAEFWIRQPDLVGVLPDLERGVAYPRAAGYTYNDQEYDQEDFIHWKFPHPENPWRGISLISAVANAVIIDAFAQAWSKSFLKEGGRPDWALVAPTGTTPREREALENKLSRKFQGWQNVHKPIVLEEGVYDIKTLSFPPTDMQWLEQRKVARDEIAAIFGVPDILMGFGDDTYDTEEKRNAALRTLWVLTLIPLIEHRDDQLNTFFTRVKPGLLAEGEYIVSDLSDIDILREDTTEGKIPLIDALWNKGVAMSTINTYLELGLPEYDGWDIRYLPLSMLPVGREAGPFEVEEIIEQEEEIEHEEEEEETPIAEEEEEAPVEEETAGAGAVTKGIIEKVAYNSRLHRALSQRQAHLQSPFLERTVGLTQRTMQEQQVELNRAIRDGVTLLDDGTVVLPPYDQLWNEEAENERFIKRYLPLLGPAFALFGAASLELLGPVPGIQPFDPYSAIMQASVLTLAQHHAANLNNTTWAHIAPILQNGEQQGYGIPRIARDLNEYWGGRKSKYQCERIARTMLNGAANDASVKAWDQTGVVESHEWLSALVKETRDAHKIAHGQVAPLDGWFDVDGELLRYPGDPNGSAGNIINCLCTTVPVLASDRGVLAEEMGVDELPSQRREFEGRSGGVQMDWLNKQQGMFLDEDPAERSLFKNYLADKGHTSAHLSGCKFTSRPPKGYQAGPHTYTGPGVRGSRGLFDPRSRTVSVHPHWLPDPSARRILAHEVGHHVSMKVLDLERYGSLDSLRLKAAMKGVAESGYKAQAFGLRAYSFGDEMEFMADAYQVWLRGSAGQFTKLSTTVAGATDGHIQLDQLFGGRG